MLISSKEKHGKKNRSLSVTLAVSVVTLSLASLIISGTLGTISSFQAQQNIVFSRQQLIAQNAANKVTGFIQEIFSALETSANLINPIIVNKEQQNSILNHLLGPNPAFRQLVLLNSKYQKTIEVSRLSQEASGELKDHLKDDLFIQANREKRYISPVYVDRITSEPMVVISVPVKDIFGDFKGILVVEVNLKFMWDRWKA